ncbi:MAG: DUF368 domain-containing protein [Planctomycetota bacterium]
MSGPTESQGVSASAGDSVPEPSLGALLPRCAFGGALMGLANLVPGISGGTMLLAAGVYERFINAIADLTRFRVGVRPVAVLAIVVLSAGVAIALLAGVVKVLVVEHRWIMYALFIGLTLGGVPIVVRLIRRTGGGMTGGAWGGAVGGFLAMAALALMQMSQPEASNRDGVVFMLLAGIAGASAMILPGVSGGYLLLLLGAYVPLLSSIDGLKQAVVERDARAAFGEFPTLVPVGFGVLIGVVVVSQVLRWLLARYEKPTLGVLLGLLVGAVVGLWPFQRPMVPAAGDVLKGQVVRTVEPRPEETGHDRAVAVTEFDVIGAEDWPTETFAPSGVQAASALGIALLGFGVTMGIGLLDRAKPSHKEHPPGVGG